MTAFTDEMFEVRHISAHEVYGLDAEDNTDVLVEYSLRGPGPVIGERLSLLGYTKQATLTFLNEMLEDERERSFPGMERAPSDLHDYWEAERSYLDGYTAKDWIRDIQSASPGTEIGGISWLLSKLEYHEPGFALKATLLGLPDAEVVLILNQEDIDRRRRP
ncbi:hypothetical protein [Streptomyces mirabilis]|uniref:Uncharacterized protein n=1 Tax=Streptomyces mirabilis TaxID=68239 RepID=A0ABU3V520_9ACTN|nr:hypothetical protein [Streptomyces mirabilis]MCX5355618.1 hypothetical protein [Streptomyces mirabilis]MDU9001264.1 hypothetical protein [Streptomyces mirabilis]